MKNKYLIEVFVDYDGEPLMCNYIGDKSTLERVMQFLAYYKATKKCFLRHHKNLKDISYIAFINNLASYLYKYCVPNKWAENDSNTWRSFVEQNLDTIKLIVEFDRDFMPHVPEPSKYDYNLVSIKAYKIKESIVFYEKIPNY
jgi:hypothetical protein